VRPESIQPCLGALPAAFAHYYSVEVFQAISALKDNLDAVEERIERVVSRCGRKLDEITLLAVTKVFPASVIRDAYELGVRDFGENYVQEFQMKYPEVADLSEARFHFIGHLQSNKAKVAGQIFHVIETVDTPKVADRLNATAKPLEVMLEVKLSEEESKSGVSPEDLPALIDSVRGCRNLRLTGLMTMPPWSDDPEPSRPYFRQLKALADRHSLPAISMGMSHDFEVAIEEGATIIRVGTALFGKRKKT
jgi:pyridoxal phosphate enzyme (YggS family)